METIITYVEKEMRSFAELPLGDVDSLVLSQLSYMFFDSITTPGCPAMDLRELLQAEHFDEMLSKTSNPEQNKQLLFALAASPRFRNTKLQYYTSEFDKDHDMQFAAITLFLPQGSAYIAFRGTDSTIAGWKEDCNMAYQTPVPSQSLAAKYVQSVGSKTSCDLYIGGHSKGGNLAVYAAMCAPGPISRRIVHVFDHDGPGFRSGVLDNNGYRLIEEKIRKTVPHASMIGMLLETSTNYTTVESSNIGVWQHDPFSWGIKDGSFVLSNGVSGGAMYINETVREWMDGISDEKRQEFVDALFKVFDVGGCLTFPELVAGWKENAPKVLGALRGCDPEVKKHISSLMKGFGLHLLRNIRIPFLDKLTDKDKPENKPSDN